MPSASTAVISRPTIRGNLRDGTRAGDPRRADSPADEVRPQPRRGPEQRVAFGHSAPRSRGPQDEAAIAGHEPGLEEPLAERRRRDCLAIDLADDQLAHPAVGDERRRTRGPPRRRRPGRPPRGASGASPRRARGRARRPRRRARRTPRRPAGVAGGRSRHGAARTARRRTDWRGRRRRGGGPCRSRAAPRRRARRATGRARRPGRTGRRPARRRSSRAGSGPRPPSPGAPGRPRRTRRRSPRRRRPRGSATPCRSSSARLWAWSRSVAVGRIASAASGATSDQRPAASGGPSAVSRPGRPRPRAPPLPVRFQRSARSGANVSLVTSPAHTRSHSASRTSRSFEPRAGRRTGRGRTRRRAPPRWSRIARWSGSSGGAPASGDPTGRTASRPGRTSAIRPSSRPRLPRPTHATSPSAPSSSSSRGW